MDKIEVFPTNDFYDVFLFFFLKEKLSSSALSSIRVLFYVCILVML